MAVYGNGMNMNPTNGFNMNPMGYSGMQSYPTYTQPNTTPYGMSQTQNPYSYQSVANQMSQNMDAGMNGLRGRIIENEADIAPNEAPMDKMMTFFPMKDNSCIIGRFWDDTGTLRSIKFVPEQVDQQSSTNVGAASDSDGGILEMLDTLDGRLDNLERLIKRNINYRNNKQHSRKPYEKKNQNGSGTEE